MSIGKGLNADTLKHNCNQWKEVEVKFFLCKAISWHWLFNELPMPESKGPDLAWITVAIPQSTYVDVSINNKHGSVTVQRANDAL